MAMLKNLLLLILALDFCSLEAQTTSGTISTNETWSDTIMITGDVIIDKGVLTIMPGTVIEFDTVNDNVVYGDSNSIFLVVKDSGSISADGTAGSVITFTSSSQTPSAGDWGWIEVIGLVDDSLTIFSHCLFEYATVGIMIQNPDTVFEPSSPRIEYCTFKHTGSSAIYATDSSDVAIAYCTIEDCEKGIFFDGTRNTSISYCTISRVSAGIINAGRTAPYMTSTIDHVTIYDVDSSYASTPKWWTGFGIFATNTMGTLNLTNSIISRTDATGMRCGSWLENNDYNCWYDNKTAITEGSIGSNGFESDPLLIDPANGDFNLDSLSSPCIGTASDSGDRGAWQSGAEWPSVPVTLSSFSGIASASIITLTWSTESEQDNVGWNVYRKESGSDSFLQINQSLLPGHFNSVMTQNYTYEDLSPLQGTCLYMLEQVDLNGQTTFSNQIEVTYATTGLSQIKHSPEDAYLKHQNIYNLSGQLSDLSKNGLYIIEISGKIFKRIITK